MTPHQTETDRNKVANSPWINISSVAKLNGYFDTKSLLSPTEQIVDDYDTLTAADLADFVLENSIFGYWQPVDFPILDEVGQDQTDLGVFEIWSSGSVPPPIKVTRKQGLKLHEWYNYFSDFSGQLRKCSEKELRYQVAVGGLDNCARPVAWKFLLGIYQFDSKLSDRELKDRYQRSTYTQYKLEWKLLVKTSEEAQENLFRIQKDVIRTDRSHPYYSNSNPSDSTQLGEVIQANPGLQRLCDILMTYTTTFPHREDCFVQGMADLASIILITIQDEVGAFWCFAAMMDKFKSNFREDGSGMKRNLVMLRNLIGIMDPVLYKRLEELNALHLFCAFRWILVLFRREFSVSDTQLLWDYLFADYYTPDMHIFIALAIMETQRTHILQDVGDGDDLLKYVNNLAGNIDLNLVLVESSELYLRFRRKAELDGYPDTKSVQEILEMYIK